MASLTSAPLNPLDAARRQLPEHGFGQIANFDLIPMKVYLSGGLHVELEAQGVNNL